MPLDPGFVKAIRSLTQWMKDEFANCKKAEEAHAAVKAAAVEARRGVLLSHVKSWADCLSGLIEKTFQTYVAIGTSYLPQQDNPIDWAEKRVRRFLKPRVGHALGKPFENALPLERALT